MGPVRRVWAEAVSYADLLASVGTPHPDDPGLIVTGVAWHRTFEGGRSLYLVEYEYGAV